MGGRGGPWLNRPRSEEEGHDMPDLLLVCEAPARPGPAGDFERWLKRERLAAVLRSSGGDRASLFRALADESNQGRAMPGPHIVLVEGPLAAGLASRAGRAALLSAPEVGQRY